MPSLKEYRDRISSVKSTKKITSAMKMVAASKLKKAQAQAEQSQPYAQSMAKMLARVSKDISVNALSPKLLTGTGKDQTYLIVAITSDRGLCGGFNANVIKRAKKEISDLLNQGKDVKIICVGRKIRDVMRASFPSLIEDSFIRLGEGSRIGFADAKKISESVLSSFQSGNFDVCHLIYNEFQSVLVQKPFSQQLIPFKMPQQAAAGNDNENQEEPLLSPYAFEPEEDVILEKLLPKNISIQIYRALLDSAAGEQAARMTAMDNATRNASDMIKDLTLQYNRARQAYITKELIEIISGAEAV